MVYPAEIFQFEKIVHLEEILFAKSKQILTGLQELCDIFLAQELKANKYKRASGKQQKGDRTELRTRYSQPSLSRNFFVWFKPPSSPDALEIIGEQGPVSKLSKVLYKAIKNLSNSDSKCFY